jgi:hypothetical protein
MELYYTTLGMVLGCLATSGVTSCGQLTCWLTSIMLVTKLGCVWIFYTCTPTCVIGMLGTTCYREVLSS